jgi:hypothetical protein
MQIEIDERVTQLLALYQLVALDLRFVLAATRINAELERIGDQAVNIVQSAQRLLRHPRVNPLIDVPRMSEMAEKMVRDSLDAFVQGDVELAKTVLTRDDAVDSLRDQMFHELLAHMMENPSVILPTFQLVLGVEGLGADRRPRHKHRRRCDLHSRRPRRSPPRGRSPLKICGPKPCGFDRGRGPEVRCRRINELRAPLAHTLST